MKQQQKKLNQVRRKLSALNDKLIANGRGSENIQDIIKKADPLSIQYAALLMVEMELNEQLKAGKPTNWTKRI